MKDDVKEPTSHPASDPGASPSTPEAKRKGGAPKGNRNRLVHGLDRKVKGTKRRTPVHPDEFDGIGRRRSREVYDGLGREWNPERETYRELYAAKERTRSRLDLRGWYDASGEQKQAATQWYELVERLEAMERRAREAKSGGGDLDTPDGARRLLAKIIELHPAALEFRAVFDGGALVFGTDDAQDGAGATIPEAGGGSPSPSTDRPAPGRSHHDGLDFQEPPHPLDVTAAGKRAKREASAVPPPAPMRREVRDWIEANDIDD